MQKQGHLVELLFKYILQTAPSSVKKLIFFQKWWSEIIV